MEVQEVMESPFKRVAILFELLNSPLKVILEQGSRATTQQIEEVLEFQESFFSWA